MKFKGEDLASLQDIQMIKLFRKIRHQMLSENKFTKYLIYATGEILLVVIGILIALQVNTWNENRKSKEREIYYLESVRDEFLENKERSDFGIKFHETQIKNAHLVHSVLDKDSSYSNLEEIHFAILQTGYAWAGSFKSDTWTEILSTGSADLISNDILRKSISGFYSKAEYMLRLDNEWSSFNLRYRSISGTILPPKLRLEVGAAVGQYEKIRAIELPLLSQKKLEENMSKIYGLSSTITDIIIVRKVGLGILEDINKTIDDILKKLEIEINLKRHANK